MVLRERLRAPTRFDIELKELFMAGESWDTTLRGLLRGRRVRVVSTVGVLEGVYILTMDGIGVSRVERGPL